MGKVNTADRDFFRGTRQGRGGPSSSGGVRDALVPRVIIKFKRWAAYGWKRRLCYREGPVSSFIIRAWAHILKPSSI